jgi:hypothetical protein
MKVFTKYILTLIFSMGVLVCFSQVEYDGFSKKEMKVLLLKRDSIIKSQEIQIIAFKDLTANLNLKLKVKQDSIDALIENYKNMISEMNALQSNLSALKNEKLELANQQKKQALDFANVKNELDKSIQSLQSEIYSRASEIDSLLFILNSTDRNLILCNKQKAELSDSINLLKKSNASLTFVNDSLHLAFNVCNSNSNRNSSDILNNMYFNKVYPNELHANLEFSGVIISSLNGGENSNDSYKDDFNLDEYIRTSHTSNDYEWTRDYYSQGNWNSYDNDYRNPKWQVYFATEFIPKSKLTVTNMSGTSRSLNFKFDLLNGMMIKIGNDHLEENTFLCQWKTDYYFGKRVVLWNLAHEKAGEMRDLFMRTFEINGEAYLALNNFQLLRLKSGFSPIQYDYNQKSDYYTFEGLSGNNKILTRLKDENSQSTVLDPAYCIYLFKLVK